MEITSRFKMRKISLTDTTRVKDIANRAAEVFNISLSALYSKTRRQEVQLVRMAISNLSRHEGIHYNAIAEVLDRDRCSIYHYEIKHKDLYDVWPKYERVFNSLHADIYDNPRKTLNKSQMRKMLSKEGIRDNKRGRVGIYLTSGTSKYMINTRYSNFCKTAEVIKEVLGDYDYEMEIAL